MDATSRSGIVGDGNPLDICVLTERTINHGSIITRRDRSWASGLFDHHETEDKLVAVFARPRNRPACTCAAGDTTWLEDLLRRPRLSANLRVATEG
jgi:hypothetical protein